MSNQISSQPEKDIQFRRRSRAILITLIFPIMAMILSGSMFAVALPTIREELGITADVAAWLTIAFSLPFMMFMPLYGRLGDDLGRPRLLVIGITLFVAGSLLALTANDLPLLFIGRVIQGAGSAGVFPLSLAIIAQRFSADERGRAMGAWNSVGPGTGIFAPSVGGWLVDTFGWRTIFIPTMVIAAAAIFIIRWQIPTLREKPSWAQLRSFDWGSVPLLGGTVVFLMFFISSRPVTGIEPLQDWRLLLGSVLCCIGFISWERRRLDPLVNLHIFHDRGFRLASLIAGVRMVMMMGISFLMPLYLAEVYHLSASAIGLMMTVHSIAMFIFMRLGGVLADRWSNRRLAIISMVMQLSMMVYFTLLPGELWLLWVAAGIAIHGTGAGIAMGALHRTALGNIRSEQTGAAAGVYSMTRFAGAMLSTAAAGVILQNGLDRGLLPVEAYQAVYTALAATGLFGVVAASRLLD